jgi:hypothetical protein
MLFVKINKNHTHTRITDGIEKEKEKRDLLRIKMSDVSGKKNEQEMERKREMGCEKWKGAVCWNRS